MIWARVKTCNSKTVSDIDSSSRDAGVEKDALVRRLTKSLAVKKSQMSHGSIEQDGDNALV